MMMLIYRDERGQKFEQVVVIWKTDVCILIMLFLRIAILLFSISVN
jgi:hypothetical protein